jgi:hypothetical protein
VLDGLSLSRHRDLEGRRFAPWLRRALLGLIAAVLLLGLANVFGQHPETLRASVPSATLELYTPAAVRGGLLYESRFTITASSELKDARLVLDRGWAEGLTIDTIEPSPVGEASTDGRLTFDLGHIPQGKSYVLWIQYQVNPTTVGRRPQNVDLYDGPTHVLTRHHELRVFP